MTGLAQARPGQGGAAWVAPPRAVRTARGAWLLLAAVCTCQVGLAVLGDGAVVPPGALGAGLLPAVGATVCVHALGRELYGVRAGLLGAAAFGVCGPVVAASRQATADATVALLVAAAAWLTARSVWRDGFLWAPVVSLLLAGATVVESGAVLCVPVVGALAVAVAAAGGRGVVVAARRAVSMGATAAVVLFAVSVLWPDALAGDAVRAVRSALPTDTAGVAALAGQVAGDVGPWLLLPLGGVLLSGRAWPQAAVLLLAPVAVPLQLTGPDGTEGVAAVGAVFAAPLAGLLLARSTRRTPVLTALLVAAAPAWPATVAPHTTDRGPAG
jgi:hypothetical protein